VRLPLALLLCAALAAPASANITWNWSADRGAHAGQLVTDGNIPGFGAPAAGTYTVLDVSVTTSAFLPIGSVSNGTYQMPGAAFGTAGPYTITWSGSAVTSIDAGADAGVNGLVVGDADGTMWAILGADEFGGHAPTTWDFQSADGRYGFGDDLSVAPLPPPTPDIALVAPDGAALADPGSWDFGTVTTGTGSERVFTVSNGGAAALKQLSVTTDGGDFAVTQQPMSTVQPGGTTTFAITFAPSAGGARSGALHVTSNDPDESPFDVALAGTGAVDCVVSAWSAWSACCNGTQSRTRTVLVPAAYGGASCPTLAETQSCTVAAPVVTISAPAAGASVATGATVSLVATFTDAATATHTGTWSVGSTTAAATITEPAGATPGRATGTWTFASPGSYTIGLAIATSCGGRATASVTVTVADPVASFPATPVLDNFNRANGGLGANWIDEASAYSISTNQVRHNGPIARTEWGPAVFGADQEAYLTWTGITWSASEQGLILKSQGTSSAAGHIAVRYDAKNSRVGVYTLTPPGTWSNRGSIARVTLAQGDRFGARATRDGIVRVYQNGTLLGSVSVAGWAYAGSGGRIGLAWGNGSGTRADDFGGGTLPANAVFADDPAAPAAQATPPATEPAMVATPLALALSNPAPNPAHGRTTLLLALPHAADVEMSVLDVQGREVWREPARRFEPGRWPLAWDGSTARGAAPAGVYFARVRAGDATFLRRVAIVR